VAGPTPSQEIIGQMNSANTGPLTCLSGAPSSGPYPPPPAAFDCYPTNNSNDEMDFKSSSAALLNARNQGANFGELDGTVDGGGADDQQYLDGCRRIVDFMNRMWQEQKLCDVIIQAQSDQIKAHKLALAAYSDFLVEKFCKFPAGSLLQTSI